MSGSGPGRIKLLIMDVDGVLTDGRLYFTERGEEVKVFHFMFRDGQGLVTFHAAGFRSGVILALTHLSWRCGSDSSGSNLSGKAAKKISAYQELIAGARVTPDETAFIGDDILDLRRFSTCRPRRRRRRCSRIRKSRRSLHNTSQRWAWCCPGPYRTDSRSKE